MPKFKQYGDTDRIVKTKPKEAEKTHGQRLDEARAEILKKPKLLPREKKYKYPKSESSKFDRMSKKGK